MLSGQTSVHIDTVKSDDDPAGGLPAPRVSSQAATHPDHPHRVTDSDRQPGDTLRKALDREKLGKFIICFGKLTNCGVFSLACRFCTELAIFL